MPSPFPGMDPYLERTSLWPDFHGGMLAEFRSELNARLPPGLRAGIDQYVWIHEPDAETRQRLGRPDVFVAQSQATSPTGTIVSHAAAPTVRTLPTVERRTRRYLLIEDVVEQRLLTVLELLSPSNKYAGLDREAYVAKRRECLGAGVNFVEIDLLRGGPRVWLGEGPLPPLDYYVAVCRAWETTQVGYWTFTVRDSLPDVPIPLRPDLPDTILPLRLCLDHVYDKGRYAALDAYGADPTLALAEADAAWARELSAGLPR